jgi:2-succinyl-6-hydroxy-2,4-cyclohexadiene-1-carboxylate synthase
MVRGVRLRVATAGSGEPLLCLHGFTGSWETWWPLFAPLASSYRLVMPDLLGHGGSDAPADPTRYGMFETVADLAALMQALGETQFSCLGYSMGGRIALSIACLLGQRIRHLILESASPGLETEEERSQRRASDEALAVRIERDGIAAFVREWEAHPLFASQRRLPQEVQVKQRAIRLRQRPEGLAGSLRGIGTGSQPSWWDHLRTCTVPVMLVTGAWDEKYSAIARRMQSLLPNARHVVVEQAGHAVHLEQPHEYVRIVANFLRTAPDNSTGVAGS